MHVNDLRSIIQSLKDSQSTGRSTEEIARLPNHFSEARRETLAAKYETSTLHALERLWLTVSEQGERQQVPTHPRDPLHTINEFDKVPNDFYIAFPPPHRCCTACGTIIGSPSAWLPWKRDRNSYTVWRTTASRKRSVTCKEDCPLSPRLPCHRHRSHRVQYRPIAALYVGKMPDDRFWANCLRMAPSCWTRRISPVEPRHSTIGITRRTNKLATAL